MKQFQIRYVGLADLDLECNVEENAYEVYDVFCKCARDPNSTCFGAGVQLIHNGLCIREFTSHATTSQSGAR
jgi:hypothetical protein